MDARRVFGINVANARSQRGISQTQLAALLEETGVSQSYISQLEAGKRNPKLETIVALAIALNVPVEQLVAGCDRED
jgi:transcriptional regulator with XRE-family HTH domain